jgi:hypothetical protein
LIIQHSALHKSHKIHYRKLMLHCTLTISIGYVLSDDIDD